MASLYFSSLQVPCYEEAMAKGAQLIPGTEETQSLPDALIAVIESEGHLIFREIVEGKATSLKKAPHLAKQLTSNALAKAGDVYQLIQRDGIWQTSKLGLHSAVAFSRVGLEKAKTVPGQLLESLSQTKAVYLNLPTTSLKVEFILTWFLYIASFLGGTLAGYQAPMLDMKLTHKKGIRDGIVLHSFPLFAMNLILEWAEGVLNRVDKVSTLNAIDHRRLGSLKTLVRHLGGGVATGALTREWQRKTLSHFFKRRPHEWNVALDKQAYELAEQLFRSLAHRGRNKST